MPNIDAVHLASLDHVIYCFDVLSGHYSGKSVEKSFSPFSSPLFVTWNKVDRAGFPRLRGCIGTLEPRPLPKALKDYALNSALHDRRFPPIAAEELSQLQCTVSFLHSFEKAAGWSDWEVGIHGLIIDFREPGSRARRSATFLPEVASHEGWSVSETLEHLIRKAGYQGNATDVLSGIEVTKYQSSAASMSYAEYFSSSHQQSRDQVSELGVPIPAFA